MGKIDFRVLLTASLAFTGFLRYHQMVRVFKSTRFSRFARKESIAESELLDIVDKLKEKQFDADLGGNVFKMRLARPGEGKSGGYRVMVFFRKGRRTFFVHGFAKSETANISRKELSHLKKQAKTLFAMTETQIEDALKEGVFQEVEVKEDI